jgi:hypothetical protein
MLQEKFAKLKENNKRDIGTKNSKVSFSFAFLDSFLFVSTKAAPVCDQ